MSENTSLTKNTSLSFVDALKLLETHTSQNFVSTVWIPSLNSEVKTLELTAKQQKKLLNSAIDSTSSVNKSFIVKAVYEVLLENLQIPEQDIKSLSYIDRLFLILNLKRQISDTIKVEFDSGKEVLVNISNLIEAFKELTHPEKETIVVDRNSISIKIVVSPPSIKAEVEYFDAQPSLTVKESETETLKEVVSEAYIYETSKYIESVTIDQQDLNYNIMGINQRCALVEKLPALILQKILEIVTKWKSPIDKVFTIESEDKETKVLDINNLLFLN
jgi:hypothetical protein